MTTNIKKVMDMIIKRKMKYIPNNRINHKLISVVCPVVLFMFITISVFSVYGCSNNDNNSEKKNVETESTDKHSDENESEIMEVALTENQITSMGILTDKVALQNISGYIKVNGEVVINPDQESKVGSTVPGRIKKIYVKEGAYVKAGQTLAIIENPQLIDMQVEYINAKNDYEYSKKEYERQLKLSTDNIGSKKTLNELETNYKRSLATYKTLEEKLSIYRISKNRFENIYEDTIANLQKYITISAPISGNLVERNVTIGQYVEPANDMFHIVNTSTVFVDLNVFEKDLPLVSSGQKVSLEVSVDPYEVYEGIVVYVNKVFDDEKRTVKVRVAINNKRQKLLPNMFVSAKIYVKQESVLAVPISSVEEEGENKFIFVRTNETIEVNKDIHDEEGHKDEEHTENEQKNSEKAIAFKKVLINTGISDDKYIQIFPITDLQEGEMVVIKGTFYLKSELKKGDLGEHDH